MTYHAEWKVQSVTTSANDETQNDVYDASGTLLPQTDPVSGAELFLGDTELHEAAGATTATATRTYSVGKTPVAERDSAADGTTTVFALDADIDRNVDVESNVVTGATTRRWFDPFGNLVTTADSGWSSDDAFLNKSASAFTALTQVGARAYDSVLGRFLSVDPLLNVADTRPDNGYAYSDNDPITYSDPSGLCLMAGGVLNTQTHCAVATARTSTPAA
jgi:RHS repeat-associated protein